jgi:hypothetical protein
MTNSGKASSAAARGGTEPRPVGRPSKYLPAYCEGVVSHCAQGYSIAGYAGEIDVSRSSITQWAEDHKEFSEAVERAKAKRAQFWEKQAINIAQNGGPGGQATMVIFGLKNHAPEDYKDKTETEITIRGELAERLDELRKRRLRLG